MSTYSTHHEGIERVMSGLDVVRHSLRAISVTRFLPAALLTGAVTAILVGASHLLADLFDEGAITEWLLMWGIALLAVWLLAGQVRAASAALLRMGGRIADRWRRDAMDAQAAELARHDPRVAADLQAARLHAERLAEEARA